MKDGVAVSGVSSAGDFAELLGDRVPLAEDETGKSDLVELLVEGKLAGEEAAIESGEGEFEIIGVEAAGFFDGAGVGAGAKADVPHALDDGANGVAGLLFGFFVGEGEEDVDVGIREEIFAAVAAEGQQRGVLRRQAGVGSAPHFNQDAVDDSGSPADGSGAVAGTLPGLAGGAPPL